ncbi:MAG TPA: bifunctional phosphopantothenoylcysteine decarboxylase/phosphopantothenate--cysteine ligase CoaBC [Thermoanaerobaculia bacterium]|nr:bifunctional phosphopantothenoylcysteine decarboxylase/phosphopantothenate--cysteine ligase CoaBC [Thermoanaerobaculia bacterium]
MSESTGIPPRRVLLGVCGGIAAYKSAALVRAMRARGFEVRCALTRNGARFVAPLTLEVLSGQPVAGEEYLDAGRTGGEELHVTLGQWADALCVAPATANTLARLAYGIADDFLATTALMVDGPWVLAPAMHSAMWERPAIREAVERLRSRGALVVGPATGALASGEIGPGRMAEPVEIAEAVARALGPGDLRGVRVLVTAGPTFEAIDPVRFLGNRSSGRMGFALAAAAARRGALVSLVAGPVAMPTPSGVEREDVECALEMKAAVERLAAPADLVIMAAAVADYRPATARDRKHKRVAGAPLRLELVENPDILAGLRDLAPRAVLVGFAAETEDLLEHARQKLARKRVDLIVANDVSRPDIGFGSEHNEVVVLAPDREPETLPRAPKQELADRLLDRCVELLAGRAGGSRR